VGVTIIPVTFCFVSTRFSPSVMKNTAITLTIGHLSASIIKCRREVMLFFGCLFLQSNSDSYPQSAYALYNLRHDFHFEMLVKDN